MVYEIEVEVRQSNGKIVEDKNNNPIMFTIETGSIDNYISDDVVNRFERLKTKLFPILKDEYVFTLDFYTPNEISGTYINLASYYSSEDRLVFH